MDPIAETFGSNRIIHGVAITNPLAEIDEDPKYEYSGRKAIVEKALEALTGKPF